MTQQSNSGYFDLHTVGEGYLSRARHVTVRKGKPFLAVNVSAYHGLPGEYTFVPFDVKVVGAEARKLIEDKLMDAANDRNRKVKIGFRIADPYIDTYTIAKGDRAGQVQASVKGRLLKVLWAEVDGECVFVDPNYSVQYGERDSLKHVSLSVRGLGYLNRVMKNRSGIVGSLGAFHGSGDEVTYLNFDVHVVGAGVVNLVESKLMAPAVGKDDRVLIGFRAVNPSLKSYKVTKGENAGQQGFVLAASITDIPLAKVNGQIVHQVISPKPAQADEAKTGTDDGQV
ncbi:DUF3577 domain-containing protein [Achromobacter aloeverae]